LSGFYLKLTVSETGYRQYLQVNAYPVLSINKATHYLQNVVLNKKQDDG
jgi:hypothetical protein